MFSKGNIKRVIQSNYIDDLALEDEVSGNNTHTTIKMLKELDERKMDKTHQIDVLVNQKNGRPVKVWYGTLREFTDTVSAQDPDVIYLIEDYIMGISKPVKQYFEVIIDGSQDADIDAKAFFSDFSSITLNDVEVTDGVIPNHSQGSIKIYDAVALTQYSPLTSIGSVFGGAAIQSISGKIDTSNTIVAMYMFDGATLSTAMDISQISTKSMTNISNFVSNARAIDKIDVSSVVGAKVSDMSAMFLDCKKLQSVDLSGMEFGQLENINNLFYGCTSLKSIYLPTGNTRVRNMSGTYRDCKALKSVDLSQITMPYLYNVSRAFQNSSVETVIMPDTLGGKVMDVSRLFDGCSQLMNYNISNIDTSMCKNFSYMLNGCSSLKNINSIYDISMDSAEDISYIFSGTNTQTIDISNINMPNIINSSFMFSNTGDALKEIILSSKNVMKDLGNTFARTSASKITFNDFDFSKVTNMSYCFNKANRMDSIVFNSAPMQNCDRYTYAFGEMTSLRNATFSNMINSSSKANNISLMFAECPELLTVDFSNNDLSSVTNFNSIFYSCIKLHTIDFSNTKKPSLGSSMENYSIFSLSNSITTMYFNGCDADTISFILSQTKNMKTFPLDNVILEAYFDSAEMFPVDKNNMYEGVDFVVGKQSDFKANAFSSCRFGITGPLAANTSAENDEILIMVPADASNARVIFSLQDSACMKPNTRYRFFVRTMDMTQSPLKEVELFDGFSSEYISMYSNTDKADTYFTTPEIISSDAWSFGITLTASMKGKNVKLRINIHEETI